MVGQHDLVSQQPSGEVVEPHILGEGHEGLWEGALEPFGVGGVAAEHGGHGDAAVGITEHEQGAAKPGVQPQHQMTLHYSDLHSYKAASKSLRRVRGRDVKTPTGVPGGVFCELSNRSRPRWKGWLPGQDSNLRPIGYEFPGISTGLGLSHHPPDESGKGVGRL